MHKATVLLLGHPIAPKGLEITLRSQENMYEGCDPVQVETCSSHLNLVILPRETMILPTFCDLMRGHSYRESFMFASPLI